MKFSPCTNQCTQSGTHCQGCGRTHTEINETKALTQAMTEHLLKYRYDDPETFTEMVTKKAIIRFDSMS